MKRKLVIATVAAVALVGGGTATALAVSGGDDDASAASKSSVQVKNDRDDDRDDRNDRDDKADDAEDRAEARAAKVTAADAIAAALKHTPGTAVSAELDDEDGGLVWDVDVLKSGTWHSVEVDPGTGKVLGSWTEKDDDGDASRVASALKGASVSAQDAAKAAAAKGAVTSVDLDDDDHHGAAAWETETTKGDWKVDLKTAQVTPDHEDRD
ncbi:PepSY domain-containing protein [Actinomycetota bacterium Odt1-20B]